MPPKKRGRPAAKPMTAHILDLPSEVIVNICSYLSVHDIVLGFRQTCQCFNQVSFMPDLWKRVVVYPEKQLKGIRVSENFFLKLLHQKCILPETDKKSACFSQFRGLAITNGDKAGDASSKHNGTALASKRTGAAAPHPIGSDGDASDPSEVRCVATSVKESGEIWPRCSIIGEMFYPNLRSLTLKKKILPPMGFLTRYATLQSLHIEMEEEICDKTVSLENKHLIAQCFDALKNLKNLQALKFITYCNEQLDDVVKTSVTEFFQSGPKLRRIHLDLSASEDSVRAMVDHCSELRDLRLAHMKLTAAAFARSAESPNLLLSTLKVSNCPSLDDQCLEAIALAFPNIQVLELTLGRSNTFDQGLWQVLRSCAHLTDLKLTLHHDTDGSDQDLDSSIEDSYDDDYEYDDYDDDDDSSDENWETADEDNSELDDSMTMCSGKSLSELATKPGKLQTLELDGFRQLPSSTFERLLRKQPNLREFKVKNSRIDDVAIITLAKHCPLLRELDLFDCPQVTSTSLTVALRCLPWLQDLDSHSFGQGLGTFEELVPVWKSTQAAAGKDGQLNKDSRLLCLYLCPCYSLSTEGVSALTSLSPNLNSLSIGECCSLNDECVSVILRNCVSLQFLMLETMLSFDEEIPLTDASLHTMQSLGRALKWVEVSSCCAFTSAAIAKMVVHSAQLTDFSLRTYVGRRFTIQHLSDLQKGLQLQLGKVKDAQKKEIAVSTYHPDPEAESGEVTLDIEIIRPRPRPEAVNRLVWLGQVVSL